MFSAAYAPIHEAWGPPPFHHIETPYRDTSYQDDTVVQNPEQTRGYLRRVFQEHGVHGVCRCMDPAIVHAIQRLHQPQTDRALFDGLGADEYMYIVLALFALLFAFDV